MPLVCILLIGSLVLAESVEQIEHIIILLMSDPGLYFVEIDLACEQILFVFVFIEVLQSFDVFIDVCF